MARPLGAQNKDKPFREALRMELAALGENHKGLRMLAKNLIQLASEPDGNALQAIREIADRLDGKPAQEIVGDPENPIVHKVEADAQLGVFVAALGSAAAGKQIDAGGESLLDQERETITVNATR